jgi:hypothetical protein
MLTYTMEVFYLYGEAALTGLTFSSLLGGMVSILMCLLQEWSDYPRVLHELLRL